MAENLKSCWKDLNFAKYLSHAQNVVRTVERSAVSLRNGTTEVQAIVSWYWKEPAFNRLTGLCYLTVLCVALWELKKTMAATATATLLNKRFKEQHNSCASMLWFLVNFFAALGKTRTWNEKKEREVTKFCVVWRT